MEQQIVDLLVKAVSMFPIMSLILGVLGTLVVLAQIIIPLTPSKSDDLAWERIKAFPIVGPILVAFTAFAVIQKK